MGLSKSAEREVSDARKVLDAIDTVCFWCHPSPGENEYDPCEGCKVLETADRMWNIIDSVRTDS